MNRRKFVINSTIGLGGLALVGGLKIYGDSSLTAKVTKNLGTSVDLHSHTTVTYEGNPNLGELTKHCINIGLDTLVFTNFVDSRYEDLKNTSVSLGKRYEMLDLGRLFYVYNGEKILMIIKGQEIPTKGGHILTIGGVSDIKNYNDLEETLKEAKDKDAIIIADHPFTGVWGGLGRANLDKHLESWDAIETFNSQNIALIPFLPVLDQRSSNDNAKAFTKEYNLPGVATSDSHRLNEVALSYITFKEKINHYDSDLAIYDLRKVIKENKFENVERYNHWGSFVNWAVPFQIKAKLGLI